MEFLSHFLHNRLTVDGCRCTLIPRRRDAMTRGLTAKQDKILKFIVEYVNDKGYPPSIREIGNSFGISSLRGVTVHLDALERKGFIKRSSTSRSITVIGQTGATA